MKTALIIGASGMIGKELTRAILESNEYEKLTLLLRSPLTIRNPKLEQHIYDFDQPKPEKIMADHIFCCLGSTIKKAGSKERFYQIDHDYALTTARMALLNHASLFSLVSSMGADPKSRIFYNQTKGKLEEDLKGLNFPSLQIFRPSLLLGERKEKRFGEKVAQVLMTKLDFLIPEKYKAIESKTVAMAMVANALANSTGFKLIENDQIPEF
jgi:uncharacterized protein YbjT (DUF2867 family)